ncbi:hypothetical protein [Oceanicoccus sp. KOV_DT_Chl]|uniref:hypothetical protein n=1 Tax=Oceanicoccus sp. KOV_DT_Chl TaxID=1904639 RepID=UPI000C7A46DF|nr:hypothetical protein [Oceanicoccus sp. KOV_DT_Chl]
MKCTAICLCTGLAVIALTSLTATAQATQENIEKNSFLSACIPQLNEQNTLSIPNVCSYAINNYLATYLPEDITNPSNENTMSFQQRAYYTSLEEKPQKNDCTINETVRLKLSMAITNKLVASGQSTKDVEQIIASTISNEYPC